MSRTHHLQHRPTIPALLASAILVVASAAASAQERPRARELGIEPGILTPGTQNAITDVEGVAVGHSTLIEGETIRTGVTAVVPHPGNVFQQKVPAAAWAANAFGKAAGFLQVQELGTLETPIVLTNTLNVGTAVEAVVAWTLEQNGNEDVVLGQRGSRRNQRRLSQRHPRPARQERGTCDRSDRERNLR